MQQKESVYVLREADVRLIECVLSTLRVALSTIITARTIDPDEKQAPNFAVKNLDHIVDQIVWDYGPDTNGLPDVF